MRALRGTSVWKTEYFSEDVCHVAGKLRVMLNGGYIRIDPTPLQRCADALVGRGGAFLYANKGKPGPMPGEEAICV